MAKLTTVLLLLFTMKACQKLIPYPARSLLRNGLFNTLVSNRQIGISSKWGFFFFVHVFVGPTALEESVVVAPAVQKPTNYPYR